MQFWQRYKYKNITLFLLSIIYAYFLFQYEGFHKALLTIVEFEYIGAFLAGIFYVSTFTMPTGIVMLFIISEKLHPLIIALIAGAGTVTGDLIIFHAARKHISSELLPLYYYFGGKHINRLLSHKYLNWLQPFIFILLMISPIPDELTIGIIGLSKMKTSKFLLLSYIFNTIGILIILSAKALIER